MEIKEIFVDSFTFWYLLLDIEGFSLNGGNKPEHKEKKGYFLRGIIKKDIGFFSKPTLINIYVLK